MIIRVLNCNYQNRPNQNTTISINKRELGFQLSDIVSEDYLLHNIETIVPHIFKQRDTKIKIVRQ
jgi:hypothetical protein